MIPEWKLGGDNQIIVVGLLVLALLVGVGLWNALTGDDDGGDDATEQVDESDGGASSDDDDRDNDRDSDRDDDGTDDGGTGDGAGDADGGDAADSAALTASVGAALADYRGVRVTVDEQDGQQIATLDGVVGTDADRAAAGDIAASVDGIDGVDNRLTPLATGVEAALASAGVENPSVTMDDTVAFIGGSVPDADAGAAAVSAVGAVPGVSAVIDELTITSEGDGSGDADGDTGAGGDGSGDGSGDGDGSADGDGDGNGSTDTDTGAGTDGDGDAGTDTTVAPDPNAETQARVDDALAALGDAGAGITATVADGQLSISGTAPSDSDRNAIVAALSDVEGVNTVVAEISVPEPPTGDLVEELNTLLEANPVQFFSDEATIRPESFEVLDQVAELLAGDPVDVVVEGYTDILGDAATNLELSQLRAEAVIAYLAEQGVDTSLMEAVGRGETEQFGAGNSREALAANRRVQFVIGDAAL